MSGNQSTPAWIVRLAEGVREEWPWWVAGQLMIGLVLIGLGVFGVLPEDGLSGFVGCFLLVYAALILLQHPRAARIGAAAQRRLHAAVASSGVGFYGVVCLARFLQLELHDLIEGAADFEATRGQLMSILREWLIGFSMQSLMNSIEAMLWPWKLIAAHGMAQAALVFGPLWAMYRFGAWLYPELHRQIEAESEDADDDGEGADRRPVAGEAPLAPPPPPPAPPA